MLPGLSKQRDSDKSRFNNMTHGLRSQFEVIPGESLEEYESFRSEICDDLKPDGALQKTLVDRLVFFLWRLKRAARAEAEIIKKNQIVDNQIRIDWQRLLGTSLLEPILRYETNSLRHLSRILEELRNLKMGQHCKKPEVVEVVEKPQNITLC